MGVYPKGTPIEIEDTFYLGGIPTDPTTIVYTVQGPDGVDTTYTWPWSAQITRLAEGNFLLSLDPPTLPGDYLYTVDATGAVEASRNGTFTVLADPTETSAATWAIPGPCTPWTDSQDIWNCCGQPMTTIGEGSSAVECAVDMSQYAMEASQLLYELSGRIFAGTCERTVRPCGERVCGMQVLDRGHIIWPGDSGYGYGWDGSRWHMPSFVGCGCAPLDRVLLAGYPVRSIVEVKIDGVVVPEANNWRLDERRLLTRIADADGNAQSWPGCQRLDMDDTEVGTWSVTYRYGQDPPIVGAHAAAQLGCELYKACNGGDCVLPSGTTRVTRTGVTIDKMATLAWVKGRDGWRTGLSMVDAFLSAYASGPKRRPAIWSPSGPRYARSVGQ